MWVPITVVSATLDLIMTRTPPLTSHDPSEGSFRVGLDHGCHRDYQYHSTRERNTHPMHCAPPLLQGESSRGLTAVRTSRSAATSTSMSHAPAWGQDNAPGRPAPFDFSPIIQPILLRNVAHPEVSCKELSNKVSGLGSFYWVYPPHVDPTTMERIPLFEMTREERVALVKDAFVIIKTIAETLAPTQSSVRGASVRLLAFCRHCGSPLRCDPLFRLVRRCVLTCPAGDRTCWRRWPRRTAPTAAAMGSGPSRGSPPASPASSRRRSTAASTRRPRCGPPAILDSLVADPLPAPPRG
jgi:hypothetical protein